jgi:hypothetical protein
VFFCLCIQNPSGKKNVTASKKSGSSDLEDSTSRKRTKWTGAGLGTGLGNGGEKNRGSNSGTSTEEEDEEGEAVEAVEVAEEEEDEVVFLSPKLARKMATLEKTARDQASALRKISEKKAARKSRKDGDRQRLLQNRTGVGGGGSGAPKKKKEKRCGR